MLTYLPTTVTRHDSLKQLASYNELTQGQNSSEEELDEELESRADMISLLSVEQCTREF